MTIARGVLVEIVLVVLFSSIEILQWQFLYDQGLVVELLFFGKHSLDNGQVLGVGVIDASAIAGTLVMPLFVKAYRINRFEEHIKKELQINDLLVVYDMYGLGITRLVRIYLFVGGILCFSVSESYFRVDDAMNLFEVMLCAPEASSC